MTTTFYQLPIGARFEFRGRRYFKQALAIACDEDRWGNNFQDEAEVVWERRPGEELRPPRPPRQAPRRKVDGGGLRVERRNGHLTPALWASRLRAVASAGQGGGEGALSNQQEDTWK